MCPVDLDDRLDDSLLYLLHAVKLLVQNPPCLFRVNGLKIIVLPLNIHHNRERALGMTALLRADLAGAGHCQIPTGPELDVVRKGPACAGHEVCDALKTGQLHLIAVFHLIFILQILRRGAAGQKPLNHKLQKSVLRRKLGASSEGCLADSIDRIAVRPVLSGKAHVDTMLSKPFHQAYKTGVDLQNIRAHGASLLLEFKSRPLIGIFKDAAGMVLPLPAAVIQNQDGLFRRSLRLTGTKRCISAYRVLLLLRRIVEIKNWHILSYSFILFSSSYLLFSYFLIFSARALSLSPFHKIPASAPITVGSAQPNPAS